MQELKIGDQVPSFSLQSDLGGDINIDDLKGKNIVIYFYPKDDTPGCTLEAKDFTDHLADFTALNTIVIGISRDLLKKHLKFRANHALQQLLLSDENGEVCSKFGCWVEKSMYGKKYMGVARRTFLVNAQGIIAAIWPEVKISGHAEQVLSKVKELNNRGNAL